MSKPTFIILFTFMLAGGILRFYNLNWGAPFYFHPDERNIASSISQLVFPTQLNPHFFAYGSFPIYLVFTLGLIGNMFRQNTIQFEQAIVISRLLSCLLSIAIIPSIYFIGKVITRNNFAALMGAFLTTGSIGFIQFAHFGTFEMWLTFLGLWFFYFSLRLLFIGKIHDVIYASLVGGILLATKVSSLVLLPIPIFCLLFFYIRSEKRLLVIIKRFISRMVIYLVVASIIYIITNPFVFLDTKSFLDSMHYETSVATGTLPVFYTGEFFSASPVIFQMLEVFPFLLNPFIAVSAIISFLIFLVACYKTKHPSLILLLIFFLILFSSQAILFVKWTRYMVPTLPFIYLIIAISLHYVSERYKQIKNIVLFLSLILVGINMFFGFFYTQVAFGEEDTRLQAVDWAIKNIPDNSHIVSEVYDLGIVPFNPHFPNITLFNFYDLDNNNPTLTSELHARLAQSDYIILPSQRILKPRLLDSKSFPNGSNIYNKLFDGTLGFDLVYETPCDILCKVVYLRNPVFSLEETATVFDRPTLFIFKKRQ